MMVPFSGKDRKQLGAHILCATMGSRDSGRLPVSEVSCGFEDHGVSAYRVLEGDFL